MVSSQLMKEREVKRRRGETQTTTEDFVQPVSPPADQHTIDQPFQTPDSNEEEPDTEQDGTIPTAENLRRHATLFVINTRAKSNISQKSVNTIVAGVQQYQSFLMDHLKKQMEDVLKKHSGNASASQLEKDALDVFDRQHMCYQVEVPHKDQDTEVVEVEKLVDYMPYYILNNGNQTYVLIKYCLTDVMELHCN
uniref:Uncharacterized protein n=1 Tax=Knipowitschia caucasica TaxID=637954 RepID=A0AAV2MNS2_KNICA